MAASGSDTWKAKALKWSFKNRDMSVLHDKQVSENVLEQQWYLAQTDSTKHPVFDPFLPCASSE